MDIEESIETIEAGYEFLLAYAAQGRPASDESDGPGPHARPTIEGMVEAMGQIIESFSASKDDFEQLIATDCKKASAALSFLVNQEKIGSEVVDNKCIDSLTSCLDGFISIQRSTSTSRDGGSQWGDGLRCDEEIVLI